MNIEQAIEAKKKIKEIFQIPEIVAVGIKPKGRENYAVSIHLTSMPSGITFPDVILGVKVELEFVGELWS